MQLFSDVLDFEKDRVIVFKDLTRKKVIEKLEELSNLSKQSETILAIGIFWIGHQITSEFDEELMEEAGLVVESKGKDESRFYP